MTVSESEFQFNNPAVTALDFEINDDFNPEAFEGFDDIEITRRIRMSEGEEQEAIVSIVYDLGQENEASPFKIHIRMESNFTWTKSMNKLDKNGDKQIDAFLKYNAPSLIMSYMRPVIANVTNFSKFPAYNIPFMDFRNLEDNSKLEKK